MKWTNVVLACLLGMAAGLLVVGIGLRPPECPECPDPFPLKGEIFYDVEKKQRYVYKGWVKLEETRLDKVLMGSDGKYYRLKEIGDIENGLFE